MFEVSREISFCYGHRILNHQGKCKHLHGHNGRAVVRIAADQLNELGMVVDFTDIKEHLKKWIDDHLDHRMILQQIDPLAELLRDQGEPIFVMPEIPTAENIAKLIYDQAKQLGFAVQEVILWETRDCAASYRPTKDKARDN